MDRHKNLIRSLMVLDLVVMSSCFTITAVLVAPGLDATTVREFMEMRIIIGNVVLLAALIALWYLLYCAFDLYEDSMFSNACGLPCEPIWMQCQSVAK